MNIHDKLTWEDFIESFHENKEVTRNLDYSFHREDVRKILNKIKVLNLNEQSLAVEYFFNKFLQNDKKFKLDPEIILSAWNASKYDNFDFNVFLNNDDFLERFFSSEKTIVTDIVKFKGLEENVKVMSIMIDNFGFKALAYDSNCLYEDDGYVEKLLKFAERENWIDKQHTFIKGRCFAFLLKNKKMKKLVDKSFKLNECLSYSEQRCEDVMKDLYVKFCKNEMKEDLKSDVTSKARKPLKF